MFNDLVSDDTKVGDVKDITEFINEWFKNKEYKNMLNNAIISTQESILKNDFYSTFNEEE